MEIYRFVIKTDTNILFKIMSSGKSDTPIIKRINKYYSKEEIDKHFCFWTFLADKELCKQLIDFLNYTDKNLNPKNGIILYQIIKE